MAKVKKSAVKVVKKIWVPIHASSEFNNVKIGESYVVEKAKVVGKPITVNLMSLTMDPKKQNISISFVVDHFKDEAAQCRVVGYTMSPVSLKKVVRRNRSKIADSFVVKTKDGKDVRIKPLMVTRSKASKLTQTEIRKQARAFIAVSLKKMTYSQFITDVVQRKFQRKLQDLLKKVHPLSVCDIRMFTLIGGEASSPAASEAKEESASEPAEA